MTLQMVLVWGIQSTVLLLAALIASLFLGRSPAMRLVVCRAALIGTFILLLGSPWLQERAKPVVPIDVIPLKFATIATSPALVPAKASTPTRPSITVTEPTESRAENLNIDAVLLAVTVLRTIWLTGIAFLSLGLAAGYWKLARLRRRCQTIDQGHLFESVSKTAVAFGVPAPEIRIGEGVATPFVAGIWRPTLFLPKSWVETQDPQILDAVCRHEVAHVAAKDLHWYLYSRLGAIFFWPQPLIWVLRRPAASASEELCDQRVLEQGYSAELYAKSLLDLREGLRAARVRIPVGIGAVAIRSGFGRRIKAIMAYTEAKGKRISRLAFATCVGLCALFATGGAMMFAAPKWKNSGGFAQLDEKPMSGKLTVRLVTPGGMPASGWAGVLLDSYGRDDEFVELPIGDGVVDVDLSIHPGRSRAILVVAAKGYGISCKRLWPVEHPISEMELAPATSMVGQVFLPDGKPASHARVLPKLLTKISGSPGHAPSFEFLKLRPEWQVSMSCWTDADGRFRIDGLPKGFGLRYDIDDPRFASCDSPDRATQLADSPETVAKPMHLEPAAAFDGLVTRDGKPVAGVRIGAQEAQLPAHTPPKSMWGEAVTDANGRFHMGRLVAGVYNVIADLQDGLDSEVTAVAHEDVKVAVGQTKTGLDFQLIPGGLVSGKVTGPDGSPIAGILVGIYGPSHPHSGAWVQDNKTGPDGRYRLRVPAGEQFVYLQNGGDLDTGQTVTVRNGESTNVDFRVTR